MCHLIKKKIRMTFKKYVSLHDKFLFSSFSVARTTVVRRFFNVNNVKEWAPICAFLGEKFKKKGNCHILSKK